MESIRKKGKAFAEKAPQGSCLETNKLLVRELNSKHIHADLAHLPKQNHVVTRIELEKEYILDPLMTKDYGIGDGEVLFTKEVHIRLMKKVAKKSPFNVYMDEDVVYKEVKED